jgi:DNA-binding protein H-NS
MTKSYTQIVKQIETLQLQAEKLRRNEIAGVVTRIREAISFYKLSATDLGLGGAAKAASTAAAPAKRRARKGRKAAGKTSGKSTAPIKFSNGAGGTWVGLGKRPQWLRDALAAGKTLADFAVK